MKPYYLKRRNEIVALINFTEEGLILDYRLVEDNLSLAPFHPMKEIC